MHEAEGRMVHMIVKAGGRGHRIVFSSHTHCDQPQAVQGCVSSRRLCKESTRESSGSEMERSERGTASLLAEGHCFHSTGRRPLLRSLPMVHGDVD